MLRVTHWTVNVEHHINYLKSDSSFIQLNLMKYQKDGENMILWLN